MLQYFVFGDSISIDDYPIACDETPGFPSLLHKNDDLTFPEFKGDDLSHVYGKIQRWVFAADGADIRYVKRRIPWAERRIANGNELLATLTIGGNDLLQAAQGQVKDLLTHPWRALRARTNLRRSLEKSLKCFQSDLRETLDRLSRLFPRILVGNIYDPSDGTGIINTQPLNMITKFVEPQAMLDILSSWNAAIATETKRCGAILVDIHAHFLGHGLYHMDGENPHYHREDPTLWLFDVIEPNGRGASELRRLFLNALKQTV